MRMWRITPEEEALLGTDTDAAVAARLGKSTAQIMRARHYRGIPAARPHRRRWTRQEIALLGRHSDAEVARRLGCSRHHVLTTRRRLGIQPAYPERRPWKPE